MKFNEKTAEEKNQDCLQGRLDNDEIFQEFNERNVGFEVAGGTARRGDSFSFIESSEQSKQNTQRRMFDNVDGQLILKSRYYRT